MSSLCSDIGLLRWAYGLGYEVFEFHQRRRLTLEDWETKSEEGGGSH